MQFIPRPVSISERGASEHYMVFLKPGGRSPDIRGNVTRVTVKCMCPAEKASFAMGLASVRWDPLFRLNTCEEKYLYYQSIINNLTEHCFPIKTVTRYRPLLRASRGSRIFLGILYVKGNVLISGNRDEYSVLRNMVNRESTKLKFEFYQKHILAIS